MSLFRTLASSFSRHFQFNRITSCLQSDLTNWRNIHSRIPPLCFQYTSILHAEPLKKKRRVDPAVLRERADKKIRRLQRDIRKLEKVAKRYKPIAELQVPKKAVRDSEHQRPIPVIDEKEFFDRAALKQEWMIFKRKEHLAELSAIQRIIAAQERAMDALEEASPDLYEQALEPDLTFIPFTMTGPTETPPKADYVYPDGDYTDETKQYLPIVPTDPKQKKKMAVLFKKKK